MVDEQQGKDPVGGIVNFEPRRHTLLAELQPDMEIGPADNRFRLMRKIGGGGMGQVWLARDLKEEALEGGERFKALKVVHPALQDSPHALSSLRLEAVRASRLAHPNIINIYGDRQGPDGWLFVVMDYLEGRDLDRLLYEEGKPGMGWKRTLELLQPMVAALDYAHRQRLLHRDLKPGNVFITKAGEVKLLDFGLAYRLRRSISMVNVQEVDNSGTPEYMPPEAHIGGEPEDIARDIYALACLIYEMLVGEPPYSRQASVSRSPDLLPNPPKELTFAAWQVLKSGLAYRKEDRPGSAGELVKRLEAAQVITETGKNTPPSIEVSRSPKLGLRWFAGLIIVVAIGSYAWWQMQPPEPVPVTSSPVVRPTLPELQALQQQTAKALDIPVTFRDPLKDGGEGSEMVVIPAGKFLMGLPQGEEGQDNDESQHQVIIERPFAIGKYEVTFEDYDRFAEATGREKPDDESWGRDNLPVINVSWEDAVAYAEWLSGQTGAQYRLPTEAEWEYAARAGTTTPFHFGATISTEQANYDGNYVYGNGSKGEYRGKTVPVGQFPGNAWGLHDVHGNVWEWTCSAYSEDYDGAEQECISKNDASALRVLRGGSWTNRPLRLRAATRLRLAPSLRNIYWGFRLARQL